jgi:hypothetical protein
MSQGADYVASASSQGLYAAQKSTRSDLAFTDGRADGGNAQKAVIPHEMAKGSNRP